MKIEKEKIPDNRLEPENAAITGNPQLEGFLKWRQQFVSSLGAVSSASRSFAFFFAFNLLIKRVLMLM